MTATFYGDLLQAIMEGNDNRVSELLGKLSLDQLQELALAGQELARMCRLAAMEQGEEE